MRQSGGEETATTPAIWLARAAWASTAMAPMDAPTQDDPRVSLLSPGHGGGDVMTFEMAERRHAGGLTVASGVVGEDVELAGLEALGESDDVAMILARGEAVGDDDDRPGGSASGPVPEGELDAVNGDDAGLL